MPLYRRRIFSSRNMVCRAIFARQAGVALGFATRFGYQQSPALTNPFPVI
jgi:hypothetical protein